MSNEDIIKEEKERGIKIIHIGSKDSIDEILKNIEDGEKCAIIAGDSNNIPINRKESFEYIAIPNIPEIYFKESYNSKGVQKPWYSKFDNKKRRKKY